MNNKNPIANACKKCPHLLITTDSQFRKIAGKPSCMIFLIISSYHAHHYSIDSQIFFGVDDLLPAIESFSREFFLNPITCQEPPYFYIGLIISGMTLLGCVGYLVYDWGKERKIH